MDVGDADILLRHLTRGHPEALAGPFVPGGPIEDLRWIDTQVTALERRLDKALALRVAGEERVLHVEFEYEYRRDLPFRVFGYQTLTLFGLESEAPGKPLPPIESVVILLTGREEPWPAMLSFSTGWPERPFSGVHFRLDAVYQRTVAELRARGSLFWLIFTPLTRDATAEAIRDVVETFRAEEMDAAERTELLDALLTMAELDPWGHTLLEEIEAMTDDETEELRPWLQRSKRLRKMYDLGAQDLLANLFRRRLHRALTAREQEALRERAETLGPVPLQDKALSLEGDALAAWLLDPDAK